EGAGNVGVSLADFAERRAGDVALVEADEGDAKFQQHVGGLLGLRVVLGGGEEDFRRVAVFLLAKQRFAQPVMRVRRLGILGEAGDVVAETLLGGAVVARQDELVGVAVKLVGIIGGGQCRDHRVSGVS